MLNVGEVVQALMLNKLRAALGSAMNRGRTSVLEGAAPSPVENAGGAGAKLRFTVAVPGGGEFCPTLALNVAYTANFSDSLALGFVFTTSQTAVALPLFTWSSATGTFPFPPGPLVVFA